MLGKIIKSITRRVDRNEESIGLFVFLKRNSLNGKNMTARRTDATITFKKGSKSRYPKKREKERRRKKNTFSTISFFGNSHS